LSKNRYKLNEDFDRIIFNFWSAEPFLKHSTLETGYTRQVMSQNKGQIKNGKIGNNASQQMREGKPEVRHESSILNDGVLPEGISSRRTSNAEIRESSSLHLSNKDFLGCDRSNNAPDLVCLSHLRWNFVFQRPQHLLTRLAQGRRVFFIEEPVFILDSSVSSRTSRGIEGVG
jgi:hypothetical protein